MDPSSMLTLRALKSSLQYFYLDKDERLKWAHFKDVSSIEHKEGILTVLIRGSWFYLGWHNHRHNKTP